MLRSHINLAPDRNFVFNWGWIVIFDRRQHNFQSPSTRQIVYKTDEHLFEFDQFILY